MVYYRVACMREKCEGTTLATGGLALWKAWKSVSQKLTRENIT